MSTLMGSLQKYCFVDGLEKDMPWHCLGKLCSFECNQTQAEETTTVDDNQCKLCLASNAACRMHVQCGFHVYAGVWTCTGNSEYRQMPAQAKPNTRIYVHVHAHVRVERMPLPTTPPNTRGAQNMHKQRFVMWVPLSWATRGV